MDYEQKYKLARDESTSPEVLEELSKDRSLEIRRYVATNSSTPEKALVRLSKSQFLSIRMRLAENPSFPEKNLLKLSQDICFCDIREAAIKNKNLGGILKEMLRVSLVEDGKVDWDSFGWTHGMRDRLDLKILRGWTDRYFHGL